MKQRIFFWILTIIIMSFACYSIVNAADFDASIKFKPTLSNVTYNLTRSLSYTDFVCHSLCLNITGGPEAYNYCNTSATNIIIHILAPPIIDTYEPLTNPSLNDLSNYSFNITWHDVDGHANIDWYMNETNQTGYWNYTTFNTSIVVTGGEYNITVIISDNNGSTYHEWIMTNITNVAPNITSVQPIVDINITETERYSFNVTVSDDDGNPLIITWYLNGSNQTEYYNYTTYNYTANMSSSGDYNVTMSVTDDIETVSFQFNMTVTDVTYDAAGGGTAGPPGSGYSREQKCELINGTWLQAPDGTYYCSLEPSKIMRFIDKLGSKIMPSNPKYGFIIGVVLIILIFKFIITLPSFLYLKKKEKKEKENEGVKEDE